MKTKLRLSLKWVISGIILFSSAVFLTNCKGKADIYGIIDSVENCSPPFVVYFYADAEHRSKKLDYTWSFGDGTESHEHEPVHIYYEYDVYDVTLHIKQNKVEDYYTYKLYLTEDSVAVVADWDYATLADSLWVPAYVEFQNYSEHATNFIWDFDDGDTSSAKNPTHIFTSQGWHTTSMGAICEEDTTVYVRDLFIKPPPSIIDIYDVTIWMPTSFLGTDVWLEIWYDGFLEETTALATSVTSFPITFNVNERLISFNGNFNSAPLEFVIWSSINDGSPEWVFDIESRSLQFEYYPTIIGKDSGYGYAFEAGIGYLD